MVMVLHRTDMMRYMVSRCHGQQPVMNGGFEGAWTMAQPSATSWHDMSCLRIFHDFLQTFFWVGLRGQMFATPGGPWQLLSWLNRWWTVASATFSI